MPTCSHVTITGEQCDGNAQEGSTLCYFHAPENQQEIQEARSRGGKNCHTKSRSLTALPPDTADLPLATSNDVKTALAEAYNAVRTGRLHPTVANCLALISGYLLKAMDSGDTEERIERLEKIFARRRRVA
jgi:hypothetical protein